MSRFVMQDDVEVADLRLGQCRDARGSAGHGLRHVRRHGRDARRPGNCHAFHHHPEQDEMIIVKAGRIVQWLDDEHRELGPGDSVHIDRGVVHGSYNDFDETAELQVVLAPAYGEGGYDAVDVSAEEPWSGLRDSG